MLKFIIATIVTLICGLALYTGFQRSSYGVGKKNEAPAAYKVMDRLEATGGLYELNLDIKDERGKVWNNETLKGKIVILSFWATWCEPCVEEFPSMVKLAKKFPDKLLLLAVSNDKNKPDVTNFISAFQGQLENIRVIMDADKLTTKKFEVERLPESFIFDFEGRLVKKVVGIQDWHNPAAVAFFDDMINLPEKKSTKTN